MQADRIIAAMRSGAILHKQIIEAQPSIAWAEINGLAHVPVAATEAKLVRLPRLIAPMRAGDPITPHGQFLSFGQLGPVGAYQGGVYAQIASASADALIVWH